uniref:Uncharacterized protein n=1 Tax=Candidatus Kentrum sp. LFY TaxID=2126342 RepID=A0A450WFP7_9GAMM|nr:MAG: hypothetical protein BECKLFY1418C_GA0070996_101822 [Candidatus Kentron sp. LFY]
MEEGEHRSRIRVGDAEGNANLTMVRFVDFDCAELFFSIEDIEKAMLAGGCQVSRHRIPW